jgi:pectate lyase
MKTPTWKGPVAATLGGVGAAGLLALVLAVSPAAPAADEPAALPAFPGAEGFGARVTGGRRGAVYEVTNLNDDGPGSLRDAVREGNRTVVFRVAGTIALTRKLVLSRPNLTIAGQTTPGDGICLRNYTLEVSTRNVILRYLRSRLGDESRFEDDSINLRDAHDVIVDHCSATWSIDEALSLAGNVSNVTVQWCLIAEPLNRSFHKKGAHGYGSLARANGPVTLHHNLWAHCNGRNPRLGDNYGRPPYPTFDVRNNVMYDYGATCTGLTQGKLRVNHVANYIKPGPSSRARYPIHVGAPSELRFFIRDNVVEGNEALTVDNARFFDPVEIDGRRQVETVAEPFAAPPVRTQTAREAYEAVLATVGASRPVRDPVDARIVDEVRRGGGKIIDSQKEVGGWPELRAGAAPVDSDHDGIPDDWEARHGLDPHDPSDAARPAAGGGGYTNLEVYLNELAGAGPKQR